MIGDPAFFLDDRIGVERLDQGVAGRIMPAERAVGREMLFVEAVLLERRAARPGARHLAARHVEHVAVGDEAVEHRPAFGTRHRDHRLQPRIAVAYRADRSEEHTSELQSLMRISYAVFCLQKKTTTNHNETT